MVDTDIRSLDMEDNIFRITLTLPVPINKVFIRKFIKYDIRLAAAGHSVEIFPYDIEYLFSELRELRIFIHHRFSLVVKQNIAMFIKFYQTQILFHRQELYLYIQTLVKPHLAKQINIETWRIHLLGIFSDHGDMVNVSLAHVKEAHGELRIYLKYYFTLDALYLLSIALCIAFLRCRNLDV